MRYTMLAPFPPPGFWDRFSQASGPAPSETALAAKRLLPDRPGRRGRPRRIQLQIAGSAEMACLIGFDGRFGRAGYLRLNPAGPARPARPVCPQRLGRNGRFSEKLGVRWNSMK